jgi:hypothetical protein
MHALATVEDEGFAAVVVHRLAYCAAARGVTAVAGPVATCAVVDSRDLGFVQQQEACLLGPWLLGSCPEANSCLGAADAFDRASWACAAGPWVKVPWSGGVAVVDILERHQPGQVFVEFERRAHTDQPRRQHSPKKYEATVSLEMAEARCCHLQCRDAQRVAEVRVAVPKCHRGIAFDSSSVVQAVYCTQQYG